MAAARVLRDRRGVSLQLSTHWFHPRAPACLRAASDAVAGADATPWPELMLCRSSMSGRKRRRRVCKEPHALARRVDSAARAVTALGSRGLLARLRGVGCTKSLFAKVSNFVAAFGARGVRNRMD